MLYKEFEKITGLEIDFKDYTEVIEPMYGALTMDKYQFCEMIKPTAKVMAKRYAEEASKKRMAEQKLVFVETKGKTPNGCYRFGYYAKVVGADIRTGKTKVRNLTSEEFKEECKYHLMHWHEDEKSKAQGVGYADYQDDQIILID